MSSWSVEGRWLRKKGQQTETPTHTQQRHEQDTLREIITSVVQLITRIVGAGTRQEAQASKVVFVFGEREEGSLDRERQLNLARHFRSVVPSRVPQHLHTGGYHSIHG